jgi:hypothetical protein
MFATVYFLVMLSGVYQPMDENSRFASCVVERAVYENGNNFDLDKFWEIHMDLHAETVLDYSKEMMHQRAESYARNFNRHNFITLTIAFCNSGYDDDGTQVRNYDFKMFALWP